jgi:hypothetical protein
MTIFDFLEPETKDNIESLSLEEIAKITGEALGITFTKGRLETENEYYEAKIGKHIKISVDKSQYFPWINDGRWFCGADVMFGTSGSSAPCDSIEEMIEWFRKQIRRYQKEEAENAKRDKGPDVAV